jgi:uncharacterized coiled-coil DUF342 family protein
MKKLNKLENDSSVMNQRELIEKYNQLKGEYSKVLEILSRYKYSYNSVIDKLDEFHSELKDSKEFSDEYYGNKSVNEILRNFEYIL